MSRIDKYRDRKWISGFQRPEGGGMGRDEMFWN